MILELGFELLPFFLIVTGGVFLGLYLGKGPLWQIIISALFLAWGFLLIYAIHIAPQVLKLNRIHFHFKAAFKNPPCRIALFSDLHAGALKGTRWVKRVVETINRENPDLILIGGDFVFRADPRKLKNYLGPLKELKAREGVYAVLGNHDYG
ncbi:MAG: metallophosphoesterase, partial [bacterium]